MRNVYSAACGVAALLAASVAQPALATDLGIAWMGESGMTNRVMTGFQERMAEIAPDVNLDIRPELTSEEELEAAVADFEANMDGMVILRSTGSEYLAANPPSIPTFIGGGNHPPTLGVLQNMDAPEGNVTGVTYFIPHEVPLQSYMALLPSVDSIMLLVQEGHPGGPVDEEGVLEACGSLGIACDVTYVASSDELAAAVSENADAYSAFLLGNTRLTMDDAAVAVEAAGDVPVFAFNAGPVEQGALAGYVADDHKLGRMLADAVVEVLIEGTPIADVAVGTDESPLLYVNMSTAQRLGIEIPFQMLSTATIIE
jgi:putative ABC transport system substrate-binding protein